MSLPTAPLVLGIDLGTSGVRAMICSVAGEVVAGASVPLVAGRLAADGMPTLLPQDAKDGYREQSPDAWWEAVRQATHAAIEQARLARGAPLELVGVCVDGTSGTIVAVDAANRPTRAAIMYNDARSTAEAAELNRPAGEHCAKLGYRFDASYALAKILWIARREPDVWTRTARVVHQADYIVGRLSGDFSITDYSNALKTGFDLIDDCWPAWLSQFAGITERLPRVVAPATAISAISPSAAEATGIPPGVAVFAGATDGVAACLASGLRNFGDYSTTLGTTLVFKGMSQRIVQDPNGLIYSHKLPGGAWLPGAASNTGAAWITNWFAGEDPQALDLRAATFLPGRVLAYPLVGRGERFPIVAPKITGFVTPETSDTAERFAACLVGTAMIERLSYHTMDLACAPTGGAVYSTGGGSRSDVWTQCRADATGRLFHRPATPESAFGSAILAAAGAHFGDLGEAIRSMVRVERTFEPDQTRIAAYDDLYGQFVEELSRRQSPAAG